MIAAVHREMTGRQQKSGVFRVFLLLAAMPLFVGCGGGGGGFADTIPDPNGGTSLTTRILWQQRGGGRGAGGFETILPSAVQAIRIALTTQTGTPCCVAIDPRDPVFDRPDVSGLVLDGLSAGDAILEVSGYLGSAVPALMIDRQCPVIPAEVGQACTVGLNETPSFEGEPLQVRLVAGSRSLTQMEIPALPIVLARVPDDGAVLRTPGEIAFVVADAATGIDPASIEITAKRGAGEAAPLNPTDVVACDDQDGASDACSDGRELEVFGFRVLASLEGADQAPVELRVAARNNDTPAAELEFDYELDARPSAVDVTFGLDSGATVGALRFDVDYAGAGGNFAGTGLNVECEDLNDSSLIGFEDLDVAKELVVRIVFGEGLSGPADLVRCRFVDFDSQPDRADFSVSVVEAGDDMGEPIVPFPPVSASAVEGVK